MSSVRGGLHRDIIKLQSDHNITIQWHSRPGQDYTGRGVRFDPINNSANKASCPSSHNNHNDIIDMKFRPTFVTPVNRHNNNTVSQCVSCSQSYYIHYINIIQCNTHQNESETHMTWQWYGKTSEWIVMNLNKVWRKTVGNCWECLWHSRQETQQLKC